MTAALPRPYTLVAELTHRCPLRCTHCSNPVDLARHDGALGTDEWTRVFEEAEALGVVHLNLTGGEPLLRKDVERLVERARALDLWVHLVTSGVPLDMTRLSRLRAAGLDSVQISFQGATAPESDGVAGGSFFDQKLAAARWVKQLGLPLTVNAVLHRGNLDRVDAFVALAERLGADRLELANATFLGWALLNRDALLPSTAAIERARERARAARNRLVGRMEVLFVVPDYHAREPKACMHGWGRRFIVVTPKGAALPCHAAHSIPGLAFSNVKELSLAEIWGSPAFEAFRGEGWMPEACRTCERRSVDFGGCRCQALQLAGDAAATDPVCPRSPHHAIVMAARARADAEGPVAPPRHRTLTVLR